MAPAQKGTSAPPGRHRQRRSERPTLSEGLQAEFPLPEPGPADASPEPPLLVPLPLLGRIVEHFPCATLLCEWRAKSRPGVLFGLNGTARRLLRLPSRALCPPLEPRLLGPLWEPFVRLADRAAGGTETVEEDWQDEDARRWHLSASPFAHDGRVLILFSFTPCRPHERTDGAPEASSTAAPSLPAPQDPLTGLLDRNGFLARLEQAVRSRSATPANDETTTAPAAGTSPPDARLQAVLLVNLDRFQRVNESFGHAEGDRFLARIAGELRCALPPETPIGRFNGDEFALLLDSFGDISEVQDAAARLQEIIARPRRIGGEEVHLSACVGIATTGTGSMHPTDLLRDADVAVHRAKARGRGQVDLYVREPKIAALPALKLETALRRALREDRIGLAFQPIIRLSDGRVLGFEALTRWTDPELGFVSPAEFIPVAEDSGLIHELGARALENACRALADWCRASPHAHDISVNVNVSGVQFLDPGFADRATRIIERSGVDGASVHLEITESVLVRDPDLAARTLAALREGGVRIALDDFGSGYSSLNYLHRFPIDFVKIDRSFIADLTQDPARRKIMKAFVILAESLDLTLVAEGIETEEQRRILRDLGCEQGQGFLFARPMPAARVVPFLDECATG